MNKTLMAVLLIAVTLLAGSLPAAARPSSDLAWSDGAVSPFWEQGNRQSSGAARAARAVTASDEADEAPRRANRRSTRRTRESSSTSSGGSIGGYAAGPKPGRWCGWYMRTRHGGGPEYNLARNWRKRGTPISGPQVGAIVVWNHHVGEIVGKADNGKWIVLSGNDSNRVRQRPRSVAGASFRVL
jgi:hypothetical protein